MHPLGLPPVGGGAGRRDGTLIFFCDTSGINSCGDHGREGMAFEAAWGINGTVCVARPRIPSLATLQDLIQKYLRLASQAGPEACTLESAKGNPDAILFSCRDRSGCGVDTRAHGVECLVVAQHAPRRFRRTCWPGLRQACSRGIRVRSLPRCTLFCLRFVRFTPS